MITYQLGLPDSLRMEAALLYDEAFRQKLAPIIRDTDRREKFLADNCNPQRAWVALEDEKPDGQKLAGLAGFHAEGQGFIGGEGGGILSQLGWIRGAWALGWFALLERKPAPGELLMDGISVASSMRGHGIGGTLLDRLTEYAVAQGLTHLRLDVVDTNPAARRLYERKGFVATKTESAPFLRPIMGFGASTTMIRRIVD